jgi:hypothetical protein
MVYHYIVEVKVRVLFANGSGRNENTL